MNKLEEEIKELIASKDDSDEEVNTSSSRQRSSRRRGDLTVTTLFNFDFGGRSSKKRKKDTGSESITTPTDDELDVSESITQGRNVSRVADNSGSSGNSGRSKNKSSSVSASKKVKRSENHELSHTESIPHSGTPLAVRREKLPTTPQENPSAPRREKHPTPRSPRREKPPPPKSPRREKPAAPRSPQTKKLPLPKSPRREKPQTPENPPAHTRAKPQPQAPTHRSLPADAHAKPQAQSHKCSDPPRHEEPAAKIRSTRENAPVPLHESATNSPVPGPSKKVVDSSTQNILTQPLKIAVVKVEKMNDEEYSKIMNKSKKQPRQAMRSINNETAVPKPDSIEFVIDPRETEYMKLRNSNLTQNRISVVDAFTHNYASYINPEICRNFEEPEGEQDGVLKSLSRMSEYMDIGYYRIQGKTVKTPQCHNDCSLVIWILEGTITIKSCGGYVTYMDGHKVLHPQVLKKGACLYVPAMTCFTLENWEISDALLGFCATRVPNEATEVKSET